MRTEPRPPTVKAHLNAPRKVNRLPTYDDYTGTRSVAEMEKRMAVKDHHSKRRLLTPEEFVARKRAGLYEREDSLRRLREGR